MLVVYVGCCGGFGNGVMVVVGFIVVVCLLL